ncbi:MAG: DUF5615 family PIN-like protein [Proteobacteria bacterium]|nr:DUF5615 family PIN-like protein [Pseudomonadota bacterium]
MKLLLDQNLSRRLVPVLQASYPGSTQVALLGLACASDRDIRDHAAQHGYVIVTKDADFRDMAVLHGVPPRIIWLRSGNGPRQAVAERLLAAHPMLEAAFADPATVCIELC